MSNSTDTIAAIATAPGRGAVGIVRVSGCAVAGVIDAICGRKLRPREATYLPFLDARGVAIDQGLAIHFPGPNSFTGEDVLELQAHGGPVILQLLLARCLEIGETRGETGAEALGDKFGANGAQAIRIAQPGEFSQRAFLNGKIDLAQAEAIADLIDASTEAAARSASRSLSGEFSNEIHNVRDALVRLRMLVEATLDFPEEDIDFLQKADAQGQLSRLQAQLQAVHGRVRQGALLREGIKVVIAGQPNVGKSSLLNALAGAELAIVTPIPGTTRDKVQQTIQIDGVPIHVVDTAGLRQSVDEVETLGIARAWSEIASADVVLFLHDLTRQSSATYQEGDAAIRRELATALASSVPLLEIWNKADATPSVPINMPHLTAAEANNSTLALAPDPHPAPDVIHLSAKSGQGLPALRARLLALAGWQTGAEGVYIARARHVQALSRVSEHLRLAQNWLAPSEHALDLLAEELRLAQNALGEITGEFTADDLLGEIFSNFCIGK